MEKKKKVHKISELTYFFKVIIEKVKNPHRKTEVIIMSRQANAL